MPSIPEYKPLAQARSYCPHFPAEETEEQVWVGVRGGMNMGRARYVIWDKIIQFSWL